MLFLSAVPLVSSLEEFVFSGVKIRERIFLLTTWAHFSPVLSLFAKAETLTENTWSHSLYLICIGGCIAITAGVCSPLASKHILAVGGHIFREILITSLLVAQQLCFYSSPLGDG